MMAPTAERVAEAIRRLQSDDQDYWFSIDKKPDAEKDANVVIAALAAVTAERDRLNRQLSALAEECGPSCTKEMADARHAAAELAMKYEAFVAEMRDRIEGPWKITEDSVIDALKRLDGEQ